MKALLKSQTGGNGKTDVSNLFNLCSNTLTESYKSLRGSLVINIIAILLFSYRRLIYNVLPRNMYHSIVLVSSVILLEQTFIRDWWK